MLKFLWNNLDWLAMIFLYVGYFRILKIKWDGWIWNGLGCVVLIVSGVAHGLLGLAVGEIGFVIIATHGIFNWRRKYRKLK